MIVTPMLDSDGQPAKSGHTRGIALTDLERYWLVQLLRNSTINTCMSDRAYWSMNEMRDELLKQLEDT